jgi:hypothetical protein
MTTAAEVIRAFDDHDLHLTRFLYCDNGGTIRGKASSRHGLAGRIESGIGLTVAMQAMNSLDQLQPVPDMGPVGEVRLVPDPATFRVLPYAPHLGAMFVDMIGLDGQPAPVCQRSFLKRMCERLAERGLRIEISFENEFSLARAVGGGYEPVDSSLCFSTIGMTAVQDVIDDLVTALDAQAIVLEQYYSELGHGQHEIATGHAPAVTAVDNQIFTRETIRGVATAHGLVASLAPKPWPGNAGNGCHIHFSLWEGGRNRFHDTDGPGQLSAEARSFIAGLLEHLPGLCGLAAPSFNSYHRIVPHYWAGAVALRRPGGGVDERGAEGGRRELQPLPRRRRPDRGRRGRDGARARAARAGAGRPGHAAGGGARGARDPAAPGQPARGARRPGRGRRAHRGDGRRPGRLLPGGAAVGVGVLFFVRRGLRAAGPLREVLTRRPDGGDDEEARPGWRRRHGDRRRRPGADVAAR